MPGGNQELTNTDREMEVAIKNCRKMLEEIFYVPGMPGSSIPWNEVKHEMFKKQLE